MNMNTRSNKGSPPAKVSRKRKIPQTTLPCPIIEKQLRSYYIEEQLRNSYWADIERIECNTDDDEPDIIWVRLKPNPNTEELLILDYKSKKGTKNE